MGAYDLIQTAFLFNIISNSASSQTGSRQALAQYLTLAAGAGGQWQPDEKTQPIQVPGFLADNGAKLIGGDWSIVWGPAICAGLGHKALNAMLVAHSPSQNTYVIAIAGTNPHSWYDWLVEDGQVGANLMAAFPVSTGPVGPKAEAADPTKVQVSFGTATGINNLMEHMYDASGKKLKLEPFLKSLTGTKGAQIIVTGHSLGGALSSTMALQIMTIVKRNWTDTGGRVLALPTAGPSPGNAMFATLWGNTFKPVPVPVNAGNQVSNLNVLVWNTQDLVPHAWDYIITEDKGASPSYPNLSTPYYIYDVSGLLKKVVETQVGQLNNSGHEPWVAGLVTLAGKASAMGQAGFMKRLPNNVGLTGTFPIATWSEKTQSFGSYNLPAGNIFGTLKEYGGAVATVHVWQYCQFFNINLTDIYHPV